MPTEMELILEQSTGVSHEVSVCIEGTVMDPVTLCITLPSDSRTYEVISFTMMMEILLEPTSNKLLVGDLCDSIRIKLVTTGMKRWSISRIQRRILKDGGEVAEDGVAGIKRCRHDLYSDGVKNFTMALGRGRLKEDLESST
ncbi:hypothetical protein Tco_0637770 [Tanacetum coccineum]